jgi:hypothetical protein
MKQNLMEHWFFQGKCEVETTTRRSRSRMLGTERSPQTAAWWAMLEISSEHWRRKTSMPQIANTSSTWAVHFGVSQVLLAYETDVNQWRPVYELTTKKTLASSLYFISYFWLTMKNIPSRCNLPSIVFYFHKVYSLACSPVLSLVLSLRTSISTHGRGVRRASTS